MHDLSTRSARESQRPAVVSWPAYGLSYAGFLLLAGVLLLAALWVFLPRDLPGTASGPGEFAPSRLVLLRVFVPAAAIVLGFLLVSGLLAGWVWAGWVLAPLARLEAQVGEQQRFAANASHELRTPLAVTQALLEVAGEQNRCCGELVGRLRAVNARAIGLTEALLLLSRAGQRSFAPERVDLSLVAEEAAEALLPLAGRHGVTIQTGGEVALAAGSPALLLQLATNLVHNAIVHNLPGGGAVRVSTAARPGGAVLCVENTGEPVAPRLAAVLTEPFQRGAGRARGGHAGAGLGLAIVKTITQAHDGTLTLTPRPAGGLRVTVRLPAPPPDADS